MDSYDALHIFAPIAVFALGVYLLLKCWPWPEPPFLKRGERVKAQIIDIVDVSPDTKRFRLSLGAPRTILGLPVGKQIMLFAPNADSALKTGTWNGEPDPDKQRAEIDRRYTPITCNETPGYVDLVVKVYRPGTVKMPDGKQMTWVDGGKMGLYMHSRKVGDFVEMMGPTGVNEYLGRGIFKLPSRTVSVRHVGMLAGGTGLTPMLQIVQSALRDKSDRCNFYLIYANKTEDDILCRDTLEELASSSRGRFKVQFTLNFPKAKWPHKQGFITKEMIQLFIPSPSSETLILTCGPPRMVETCRQHLDQLRYAKTNVVAL